MRFPLTEEDGRTRISQLLAAYPWAEVPVESPVPPATECDRTRYTVSHPDPSHPLARRHDRNTTDKHARNSLSLRTSIINT